MHIVYDLCNLIIFTGLLYLHGVCLELFQNENVQTVKKHLNQYLIKKIPDTIFFETNQRFIKWKRRQFKNRSYCYKLLQTMSNNKCQCKTRI